MTPERQHLSNFLDGLIWVGIAVAIIAPLAAAAASPLLAWRDPIYILAGFAGVLAMALLLVQPLLAAGGLPWITIRRGRVMHRWVGGGVVLAVVIHVVALWITSPPDVVDALLFASPTKFSIWGVMAMWAVVFSALLAVSRKRLHLRPNVWRMVHLSFAGMIVAGSILHALPIQGTMENGTKFALCFLVFAATLKVAVDQIHRVIRGAIHR